MEDKNGIKIWLSRETKDAHVVYSIKKNRYVVMCDENTEYCRILNSNATRTQASLTIRTHMSNAK